MTPKLNSFKIFIFIFFLFSFSLFGENTVKKVLIQVNTVNKAEIHLVFILNHPIDRPATMEKISGIRFSLRRLTDDSPLTTKSTDIGLRPDKIDFIFSLDDSLGTDLIDALMNKTVPFYLHVSDTLPLFLSSPPHKTLLSPARIKELSLQATGLNPRQKELLDASNAGNVYFNNHLDFSQRVSKEDSSRTEYVAHIDITKTLPLAIPAFFKLKGTFSSEKHNPLNYSEIYVAVHIPGKRMITAEIGRTGTQDFSTNAWRVNLGVQSLLPNFLNLSDNYARLRLKPVINGGLAFQKFHQVNNPFLSTKMQLMAFLKMYYYVPVKDKYAIICDMDASYSDNFVDPDKIHINYTLTFGYDVPLKDLKLIFKMESGKNGITLGKDTRLLMGALIDFIP